ncbi:MAG: recombinase family protein [Magnetococcales bacterium]|nr:recombinase family protein [Magnetococcales bacterium]
MKRKVAIYARVSTDGQTTENQLLELRTMAKNRGWEIFEEFVDHGISGAKSREERPAFNRMLKGMVRHQFDMIAAWSVDRLGRSLQHLVEFLSEVQAHQVDLFLYQQGLDTSTPAGRAMFQMLGVFSEFERAMIRDRVVAGIARARANGTVLGRPKVGSETEEQIKRLHMTGIGIRKIARELGIGVSVVQRVVAIE